MTFHPGPIALVFILTMAGTTPVRLAGAAPNDPPTLTRVDPPAGPGSMAPSLFTSGDRVLLSWLEPSSTDGSRSNDRDHAFRLRFAQYENDSWTEPRTIVEGVPFFANWADVPSIVEDGRGVLYAHWLEKVGEGTYAYDVRLARSIDDGSTWHHLGPAHNDGTQAEHGFVSMIPLDDGVRAFWLDGRNMAFDEDNESEEDEGHGPGSMTLRSALITDRVTQGMMLDDRVCECCGTSAVMTTTGPLIVYRDRNLQEDRDIWMVRYDGMEWTAPAPVHRDGWTIPGCPVNGPAADASGSNVVVAWYTAADSRIRILAAFSGDDGRTFGDPITLDDQSPMGRVDVVYDENGEAIVCWLNAAGMFGSIVARRVAPDGRMGPIVRLTSTSTARSSGFPRLNRLGDRLLLVWTQDDPLMQIRSATLKMTDIPSLAEQSVTPAD